MHVKDIEFLVKLVEYGKKHGKEKMIRKLREREADQKKRLEESYKRHYYGTGLGDRSWMYYPKSEGLETGLDWVEESDA